MEFVKDILKGSLVGVANIIPGVSGGTMAVSMGIYDKLISAVTHIFKDVKKSLRILMPIAIGVLLGIGILAFLIEWLFANYPIQTNLLFIGLILGGLPMIWKKTREHRITMGSILIFLFFVVLVILFPILGSGKGTEVVFVPGMLMFLKLFGVGLIASATMVIPGVSGSMMLMVMGYYNPILNTITGFLTAMMGGNLVKMFDYMWILLPFGIGVVVGIFAIAKFVEYVFEHAPSFAYCGILGLIAGSPVAILAMAEISGITILTIFTSVIAFIVGLFIAWKLGE
ncbi:MAG: DUF368 domain-containing protein [Lachnospiraceae bacterium]|nr:DUF368 domain-containing protein [Lachnospiraceae bacterium]